MGRAARGVCWEGLRHGGLLPRSPLLLPLRLGLWRLVLALLLLLAALAAAVWWVAAARLCCHLPAPCPYSSSVHLHTAAVLVQGWQQRVGEAAAAVPVLMLMARMVALVPHSFLCLLQQQQHLVAAVMRTREQQQACRLCCRRRDQAMGAAQAPARSRMCLTGTASLLC